MNGLMAIQLTDLLFFAYHGLFPEEKKTGNEYKVNLSVSYLPDTANITAINQTINYATLYHLVKEKMLEPADLLETLAMRIAEKIHTDFPQVKEIEIAVSKLHPPIEKFRGHVGVSYQIEY